MSERRTKKYTKDEIEDICQKNGFIYVDDYYYSVKHKYSVVCKNCGQKQKQTIEVIMASDNCCVACGIRGYSVDEMNNALINTNMKCVEDKNTIIHSNRKYDFECIRCGTIKKCFYKDLLHFRNGRKFMCEGCKNIINLRRYEKILNALDFDLLAEEWPKKDKTGRIRLKIQCQECGKKFNRRIDNILLAQRCKNKLCPNSHVGIGFDQGSDCENG